MTDDRLKQALADLGIDLEPRRGWEGRVLVAVGVPWWERLVIRIVSALESSIWRARDLTSRLKEFIMTRHPKKLPAVDAKPPSSIILSMTCDRPCMTERGLLVQPGTKVTYMGHLGGQAIRVRMEDGSEEVVHPHCFPELR